MNARKLPSQEYLRQCFEYDPATGELWRMARPVHHFKCEHDQLAYNGRCAGTLFACVKPAGYIVSSFNGHQWAAHRIIWKLVHDDDPEEIDHVNGARHDNRLCNLRPATRAQNACNLPKQRRNTSGFKGVYMSKGRWRAMIRQCRKGYHLGTFETPEQAHAAYCIAADERFGDFARHE